MPTCEAIKWLVERHLARVSRGHHLQLSINLSAEGAIGYNSGLDGCEVSSGTFVEFGRYRRRFYSQNNTLLYLLG